MTGQSAVQFATEARLHVSLEAADVEKSAQFYAVLFGQPPSKVRPGYVKFEVEASPVNLSLNQTAGAARTRGVSHFGVQVKSTDAVAAMKQRFDEAGIPVRVEDSVRQSAYFGFHRTRQFVLEAHVADASELSWIFTFDES